MEVRRSSNFRWTALAGLTAFICAASCTVGPNYKRPRFDLGQGYKSATTQPSSIEIRRDWWALFDDPTLDGLEQQARIANTDIAAAAARLAQARAATQAVASEFYPVITLDPSIQRSRSPRNGVFIGSTGTVTGPTTSPSGGVTSGGSGSTVTGRTSTSVRVPFDLSYEIDIWGRVRRSLEASKAQQQASEADFQVILQTLEADVAQNYFTLRSLDAQYEILERTLASYQRQLELTQTKRKAGLVSPIDVFQAQAELYSTSTQRIENRRQRADVEHALAVLLGRTPSQLDLSYRPLEDGRTPPALPVGLPAELLRRRPDVATAERTLAAASAQIGVAEADFYPAVRLTGAAGFQSFDLMHAVDWEQRVWSIGPSLSLPIFQGGRLRANLRQAKARFDESLANYRGQVLSAVRDVEDALVDLGHRADEAEAQQQAVGASREYLRLSQIQYDRGLVDSLQVIDAERTLLNNELSAAQILNERLTAAVRLIKALGGGWNADSDLGQSSPPRSASQNGKAVD